MTPADRTRWVVEQARALGFDLCGVACVEDYVAGLARMPEWLARGYAGEMRYLHDPRRDDPARVLEGARALIVCALNYNTPLPYSTESPFRNAGAQHVAPDGSEPSQAQQARPGGPLREETAPRAWISRYAWGDDYHEVLGEKLDALVAALRAEFPGPFEVRAYVDTGPVVERVAAKYAGLGWLGKNTCLINEKLGSWLFLGVILTTLELAPSLALDENPSSAASSSSFTSTSSISFTSGSPPPDLCGHCRMCLDACPTGALVEPYVMDARRCISYLTIELRGSIPEEFRSAVGRHAFGCDICQDVCPYNRKAPHTALPAFHPRAAFDETRKAKIENRKTAVGTHANPQATGDLSESSTSPFSSTSFNSLFLPSLEWLASLSESDFREIFHNSAIRRTKWRGLVRNACLALANVAQAFPPVPRGPEGPVPGARAADDDANHRAVSLLARLANSDDAIIAEHAQWASRKL